jgi:hypothetical protein
MEDVQLSVAGLDSWNWADPHYYGSLLEGGLRPGSRLIERDEPLPDKRDGG